jgi:site-specific recombinase XerD
MFRKLRWNRDRAMVAFFVSTGARAEELLGLTGEMINWGDQLIGVWRKGGNLQWVPAAPDAFIWLRLYFLERGTPGPKEAVWLTLREPSEKLAYGALRAVLSRINVLLETNWSVHDLRHTFAIRALEGGMAAHQLQELLGHASLDTTSIYATPRAEEVIEAHRAALTARRPAGDVGVPDSYDASELATLFESHL